MVKVENLSFDYSGKRQYVVSDVSFQIAEGEIFGFLGPSGAGKSTVQNLMTGLLNMQEGKITYDGLSVDTLGKSFFNQVGVSFEQPNIYPNLSGEENLRYYAGLFDVPTIPPKELLDQVGLRDNAGKKAGDYSKGMKQRLVFARALLNKPHYLFLDEPTSGLDPTTSARICDIIAEQKKRGAVIFLTTHNMELADKICDRVAFLEGGKIRATDTPYNLKIQYGARTVNVTYRDNDQDIQGLYDLNKDKEQIAHIISNYEIVTLHSSEATLEDIFIKVTGRRLTA
ncbi:MAG: ABC transporter ATP-binding protein [Enterocloster asparagiformis]|nr:ABC transporter ATP-binding protein [Enterocloster asparagiformis]